MANTTTHMRYTFFYDGEQPSFMTYYCAILDENNDILHSDTLTSHSPIDFWMSEERVRINPLFSRDADWKDKTSNYHSVSYSLSIGND